MSMQTHQEVTEHFDAVAAQYDYWKEKNWYYYQALKNIAAIYTKDAHFVLDAGCGTGGIISTLTNPSRVGIDISAEMIGIAKERYSNQTDLSFEAKDITQFEPGTLFDRILFFDVIEHVENPSAILIKMASLLSSEGSLIITMANPYWEPILMIAEKLHLKMPEGPHFRISSKEFIELAKKAGLQLKKRDWRLIFPKYIPLFSWMVNDVLGSLPLLRRLSVIEVYIFSK